MYVYEKKTHPVIWFGCEVLIMLPNGAHPTLGLV